MLGLVTRKVLSRQLNTGTVALRKQETILSDALLNSASHH